MFSSAAEPCDTSESLDPGREHPHLHGSIFKKQNEAKMFLVFIVFFCFLQGLSFVFNRSVSAFDDLGGGSVIVCFHLRGRALQTQNE